MRFLKHSKIYRHRVGKYKRVGVGVSKSSPFSSDNVYIIIMQVFTPISKINTGEEFY